MGLAGLLAVIATKNEACRQSNKLRKRVLFLLGRTLVSDGSITHLCGLCVF